MDKPTHPGAKPVNNNNPNTAPASEPLPPPVPFLVPPSLFGMSEAALRDRLFAMAMIMVEMDLEGWTARLNGIMSSQEFGLGTPVVIRLATRADLDGGPPNLHVELILADSANQVDVWSCCLCPAPRMPMKALSAAQQDAYRRAGLARVVTSYLTGQILLGSDKDPIVATAGPGA